MQMSYAGSEIVSENWPGRDKGCMPAFPETYRLVLPGTPEQAVASWSSADRSSGRSGTGGSAANQRLTATWAAAVTAPARICGYMSWPGSVRVLAAIDLDMTVTSLVKTYARGHGTSYPDLPWEPKQAFGAVASFYAAH